MNKIEFFVQESFHIIMHRLDSDLYRLRSKYCCKKSFTIWMTMKSIELDLIYISSTRADLDIKIDVWREF